MRMPMCRRAAAALLVTDPIQETAPRPACARVRRIMLLRFIPYHNKGALQVALFKIHKVRFGRGPALSISGTCHILLAF